MHLGHCFSLLLGPDHPDTLTSMNNLAVTYSNQQRWAEAETLQLQVVNGCKKSFGLQHPHTQTAASTLTYIQGMREQDPSKDAAHKKTSHAEIQLPTRPRGIRKEVFSHSQNSQNKEDSEQIQRKRRWKWLDKVRAKVDSQ